MRGEFVSKIPIWDRIPMLATTDLCISLFSVLRSEKPTLPVRLLIQRPPSGRPRTVPGYGRRGPLPGQAIFLQRTFGPHSGADPAQPTAFEVSANCGRPQARLMQRLVERSGSRIDLTGKEFSLLEYLPLNAGPRVTRFMMMMIEHIWNLTFASPTKWLPFMSTICAAKSTIATPQKLIHTVRGVGMS
jgi:hypothetical protein